MRLLKHIPPLGLALLAAASCSEGRISVEYDESDAGTANPSYDLAGVDLTRVRDRDAACASVKAEATLTKRPVDIVFVIDNSGSMSEEIAAVQANINTNFASIIGKSGLDYRVIMVTNYGTAANYRVCITAPLSGNASCSPLPPAPIFTSRFFHYGLQVESTDSFQRILGSYDGTEKDTLKMTTGGWKTWMRKDALKVFVEITDDGSNTSDTVFLSNLIAKDPVQFGPAAKPNVVWHSIIGMNANNPANKAWGPTDPLQTGKCSTAYDSGQYYQNLSIKTGGLRFPVCQTGSYDAVFNAVATGVVDGAKVACDFPVPAAPPGEKIDPNSILLEYTPMGTGTPQLFKQVKSAAECTTSSFYIQNSRVYICPMACDTVQGDSKAKLDVSFDCLNVIG